MGNRYYYERGDTYDEGGDEWDECSHTRACCCEGCYQNHPERFDEDGDNIWAVEPEEGAVDDHH